MWSLWSSGSRLRSTTPRSSTASVLCARRSIMLEEQALQTKAEAQGCREHHQQPRAQHRHLQDRVCCPDQRDAGHQDGDVSSAVQGRPKCPSARQSRPPSGRVGRTVASPSRLRSAPSLAMCSLLLRSWLTVVFTIRQFRKSMMDDWLHQLSSSGINYQASTTPSQSICRLPMSA